MLRTRIPADATETYQVNGDCPHQLQLSSAPSVDDAIALVLEDATSRIELAGPALWRVRLIRVTDSLHVLGFVFHHIIVDGWSMHIWLRDLSLAYNRILDGDRNPLAPLATEYEHFVAAEAAHRINNEHRVALEHWRAFLPAHPPVLSLPADRPGLREYTDARGAGLHASLDADVTLAARQLAKSMRCTLFHVLFATTAVTVARLGGTSEMIFGVPFHNRVRREHRDIVGYFSNVLPVYLDVGNAGRGLTAEAILSARTATARALKHPGIPSEELAREIYGVEDLPYRFCLNVQDPPEVEISFYGVEIEAVPLHNETANFDYELTAVRDGRETSVAVVTDSAVYDSHRAVDFWDAFQETLRRAVC